MKEECTDKKIKILVCYHKKDKLWKSDILCPIHCGRSIALENSKDGKISKDENKWLLDNTVGDNTGDNISYLNRDVNEMTALYWAWKNYDKLGNPDYIGLMHYRRLFNFSKNIKTKKLTFKLFEKLGLTQKKLNLLLDKYSFISREDKDFLPKYTDYKYEFYQNFVNLSEDYHPILYKQYQKFLETKEFYCTNMFIMKREDFFEMCEEIYPVMFDLLKKDKKEISKIFLENVKSMRTEKEYSETLEVYNANGNEIPRIIGYTMERIVSLYIMHLHEKYDKKSLKCKIYFKEKMSLNKLAAQIFSLKNSGNMHKMIIIFGFKIKFKRKSKKKIVYK